MAWLDRNALIAFAAQFAEFALDGVGSGDLTPDEKEILLRSARQLTDSVESLADIIDFHEAALVQGINGGYPRGVAGPASTILACALSAAFSIGARAVRSQIFDRLEKSAQDVSMAHAREPIRRRTSEKDKKILELARPLWQKLPIKQRNPNRLASIISESNPELGEKEMIRGRLRKLIASGEINTD
jgi:hypothetical protein